MPDIGCSTNAAIAFSFFLQKGLRDFQSAAVVGNLQQESRIDPNERTGDGGKARGIAQWHPPRWNALLAWASGAGLDPWALTTQLEYVWYELETHGSLGLSQLQASSSIEEATKVFQDLFERCGVCAPESRLRFARAALSSCPLVKVPAPKDKSKVGVYAGLVALAALAAYAAHPAHRRRQRA